MNISLSASAPENSISRDGFDSPVPRQAAHLHTQVESGAYLRDSSLVPRRRPLIFTAFSMLLLILGKLFESHEEVFKENLNASDLNLQNTHLRFRHICLLTRWMLRRFRYVQIFFKRTIVHMIVDTVL